MGALAGSYEPVGQPFADNGQVMVHPFRAVSTFPGQCSSLACFVVVKTLPTANSVCCQYTSPCALHLQMWAGASKAYGAWHDKTVIMTYHCTFLICLAPMQRHAMECLRTFIEGMWLCHARDLSPMQVTLYHHTMQVGMSIQLE